MGCNYPIRAYKCSDGSVVFDQRKGDAVHDLHLPCGQCDGCKMERSRQWAVRCMHEAQLYENNCFITLTYNDEHLPYYGHLDYDDFQRFMKRLRKRTKEKIRYFMCGEYGETGERPHFHACLFNYAFQDRVYFKTTKAGSKIYTSQTLNSLWCDTKTKCKKSDCTDCKSQIGFSTIGDLTFESSGYVARYIFKKHLGRNSNLHYQDIDMETGATIQRPPEFNHMSLKPGIGYGFYQKFKSDIYPHDHCVINGKATKPPKYYSKKLSTENPELYEALQYNRHVEAQKQIADNTQERREVKETCLKAKIKFLKREL